MRYVLFVRDNFVCSPAGEFLFCLFCSRARLVHEPHVAIMRGYRGLTSLGGTSGYTAGVGRVSKVSAEEGDGGRPPVANFPPRSAEELDCLQQNQDFPRTSTSSISTVDNRSNVIKATFQPQLLSEEMQRSYQDAPWSRSFHLNERNLVWNDEFRERLLTKIAAEELNLSLAEVESRLLVLQTLMPDAVGKLANMNVSSLVLLLENIDEVPMRLLAVKSVFPDANASLLAIRSTWMLSRKYSTDELEQRLRRTADELRGLFPRLNVDKIVEENPEVLDVGALKEAMEEAKTMGVKDVETLMGRDPQAILGFQRGGRMISGGFD
jgi:hypothetical protein